MGKKWSILCKTIPLMLIVLVLRLVLHFGMGFEGFIEFSEVSLVMTGGIFLIGFMLAGVMADFKESEKLPGEVACVLEAIAVTIQTAASSKQMSNARQLYGSALSAGQALLAWLHGKAQQGEVFSALAQIESDAVLIDKAGAGSYAGRILAECTNMRKVVTRIGVISRTGFLSSGYALMEIFAFAVICLLLVAKFKSLVTEVILVVFVPLIFFYMIRLIRDIDDPFEYSSDARGGGVEVSLFPLSECLARLEKQAGS